MTIIEENNTDLTLRSGELAELLLWQKVGHGGKNAVSIRQESGSRLRLFVITHQGVDAENDIHIEQLEPDCTTELYILGVGSGQQSFCNNTLIEHKSTGGKSLEVAKYILTDSSRGGFFGKIKVMEGAQRTEAYQTNRNVLMSDNAQVNTKPELEIYADDVKCSHGATTGQLDTAAIFYMQQRGIAIDEARKMLLEAFVAEITDRIPDAGIAEEIKKRIAI